MFVLLVVKYNEKKEEKAKQEKKQRQLEAVELARKLEEEKKKNGTAVYTCLHIILYNLKQIKITATQPRVKCKTAA